MRREAARAKDGGPRAVAVQAHAPAQLVLLCRAEGLAAVPPHAHGLRVGRRARHTAQLLVPISLHLQLLVQISLHLALLVPGTRGVPEVPRGAPVLRRQAPPRERDLRWRQPVVPGILGVVQRGRRPHLVRSEQHPLLLVLAQLRLFLRLGGEAAAAKWSRLVYLGCFGGGATAAAAAARARWPTATGATSSLCASSTTSLAGGTEAAPPAPVAPPRDIAALVGLLGLLARIPVHGGLHGRAARRRRVAADGADALGPRVRTHRHVPAVICGPAPRHRE